jgi:hypothetical protein
MIGKHRIKSLVCWLLLALVAFTQTGCLLVAAGAAGGAALGYAYYRGKVCQGYAANLPDTWAATHTALAELGFSITKEDQPAGVIESRAGGDVIRINVDAYASPYDQVPVTQVCVRVATFGDHPLSERVLAQIGAHLVPTNVPVPPNPPAPATGAIAPAVYQSGEPPLAPSPPPPRSP